MPENIILKLSGLSGLLSSSVEDRYECTLPGSDSDVISLVQFHLPASARVERVSAPVLETANEREKQIITVAASVRLPQIHY
jgi:hypothetical protein